MPASRSSPSTASHRRPAAPRRSDQALARREVPALRLARHPRGLAVRLDLVQGALRVPRVPRAVRPLQGALMPARRHRRASSDADAQIADAFLASTVGGPTGIAQARALPHAPRRRRASAHGFVGRGHLRGARAARGRVRLPRRPARGAPRRDRRTRGAALVLAVPAPFDRLGTGPAPSASRSSATSAGGSRRGR